MTSWNWWCVLFLPHLCHETPFHVLSYHVISCLCFALRFFFLKINKKAQSGDEGGTLWWWEIESLICENIIEPDPQIQYFADHMLRVILVKIFNLLTYTHPLTQQILSLGSFNLEEKRLGWRNNGSMLFLLLDHTARSGFEMQHKKFKMDINFKNSCQR